MSESWQSFTISASPLLKQAQGINGFSPVPMRLLYNYKMSQLYLIFYNMKQIHGTQINTHFVFGARLLYFTEVQH